MAEISLSKYGITGTTEIVHNPSYEDVYKRQINTTVNKIGSAAIRAYIFYFSFFPFCDCDV